MFYIQYNSPHTHHLFELIELCPLNKHDYHPQTYVRYQQKKEELQGGKMPEFRLNF